MMLTDKSSTKYLVFKIDNKQYAISAQHIIEIQKIPEINYPEKLPKYICGLLNYNDLTVNIINISLILDLKQKDYTLNDFLLMLKTEEAFLGIIVDEVIDLIDINSNNVHPLPYNSTNHAIKFIAYLEDEMVSILDMVAIETKIKNTATVYPSEEISKFFPQDTVSKAIMRSRKNYLTQKANFSLVESFLDVSQCLWFSIEHNNYCIELEYVQELVKTSQYNITPVPCTPEYLKGIISLRGDFISVIDLKDFIGLEVNSSYNPQKIIILNLGEFNIGFLVENIHDILQIKNSDFNPIDKEKTNTPYIAAEMINNKILFNKLDIHAILHDKKLYIEETV